MRAKFVCEATLSRKAPEWIFRSLVAGQLKTNSSRKNPGVADSVSGPCTIGQGTPPAEAPMRAAR